MPPWLVLSPTMIWDLPKILFLDDMLYIPKDSVDRARWVLQQHASLDTEGVQQVPLLCF